MNKNWCSTLIILFLLFLSGCSEHNKLIKDGWVLNQHEDAYIKKEEYSGTADKSKEIIKEIEGFWIDMDDNNIYMAFEEDGVFIEGFNINQFYPYEQLSLIVSEVRHALDGPKGEIEPSNGPMYEYIIDDPGIFSMQGTVVDFISIDVTLKERAKGDDAVVSISFIDEDEPYSKFAHLIFFERTSGYSIPTTYKYAFGNNYSYYVENQVKANGITTTGKDADQIKKEKQELTKERKKKKQEEEEERTKERKEEQKINKERKKERKEEEEERKKEEEKERLAEEQERQLEEEEEKKVLEEQELKEREYDEAYDVIIGSLNSFLQYEYHIHVNDRGLANDEMDFVITLNEQEFGGLTEFINNERNRDGNASNEWSQLKNVMKESSKEIYNNFTYGENELSIQNLDSGEILLRYNNGQIIMNDVDL